MIKEPIIRETLAYITKGIASAKTADSTKQLMVYNFLARNGSGGAAAVGLMIRANEQSWKIYNYDDSASTITDVSDAIKTGTATAILADDDDELIAGNIEKFGLLGLNGETADGGSPTYAIQYYNGTSFVTLNEFEVFSNLALNENLIVFAPPSDWEKGGVSGADSDKYYMKVVATAADGSPAIDDAWFGKMLAYRSNVSDHGTLEISVPDTKKPIVLQSGEGLMPYFSTADVLNTVEISFNNY